jgi:hypothetical protein
LNQILILLGWLWRKKIGKFRIFRTARELSSGGYNGSDQEDKGPKR